MKSRILVWFLLPYVFGKRIVDKNRTLLTATTWETQGELTLDTSLDVQVAGYSGSYSDEGSAMLQARSLEGFVPNDLWGIRDLLLIGYSAIFMRPNSPGRSEIEDAALLLARLLPELHPHEPCRTAVQDALKATDDTSKPSTRVLVSSVAEATWSCLPGHFSEMSFDAEFTLDASSAQDLVKDFDSAKFAKMTHPSPAAPLGLCRESHWPRTCSYWVSLHRMAYLADHKGQGKAFLNSVIPLLAGGATLCDGCTARFRFLNDAFLTEALRKDVGTGFCSGAQCSSSKAHLEEFRECSEGRLDEGDARCAALQEEESDVFAYQAFLKASLEKEQWPASAILVALHDIVTKSIDKSFFPDGRGIAVCLKEVLQSVASTDPSEPEKFSAATLTLGALAKKVPGLGPSATPSCSNT